MSDKINVTNPSPNDILVYSELENKFVNVRADMNLLGIELPEYTVVKLSTKGESPVSRFQGNTLRTKTIVAGEGLRLDATSSTLTLSLDDAADAQTLQGNSADAFLKVENGLSELDPSTITAALNVYSRAEAHDQFMETNASNVPDKDDTYDLGANGRRYADIFAVTFHGTATEAIIARGLTQNGAKDGDVMIWRDSSRRWQPEDALSGFLKNTGLQILPAYGEKVNRPSEPVFNVEDGNVHYYRFTRSHDISLEAPADGNLYSFTLIFEDAEDYSVNWPSNIKWLGGNEPTFTRNDVFTAYTIDGVNWIGAYAGSYTQ